MAKQRASSASSRGSGGGGTRRRSIREVCLIAVGPGHGLDQPVCWDPGRRITWAGRDYRIAAHQARPAGAAQTDGPDPGRAHECYLHLTAVVEDPALARL